MFTRSRRRFTAIELHANRETAPARGQWQFAGRGFQILVAALISIGLISGGSAIRPAVAAVQSPLGYERWSNPNAQSGVDFGLTPTQVFQKYAASLHLAMPVVHERKDKRLIDIEVRADGSDLASYVYDVVWVEDKGDFALESWFLPALTAAELHELPQLAAQGIVVVDIERYPKGQEWRYAAIVQRNSGKFGWEVLTDASLDQAQDTATRRSLRLLDLDYATLGPLDCPTVPGQACSPATFDAILVANSGSNAVETRLWLNMTPEQITAKQAQGYQVIDGEFGNVSLATVWVKPGLPFELQSHLSANEVIHEHGHQGRVVDLENSPTPFSIVNLAPSAAPASPKLDNPRRGNKDDSRHQVKPRDEKAKGKSKSDRKPKNKKGGKRGKNGKGPGR